MTRQTFEQAQRGNFLVLKEHDGKHVYTKYLAYDPEHLAFDEKKPAVCLDVVVREEDGSFTEYPKSWQGGAIVLSYFLGSKSGKVKPKEVGFESISKVNVLPPQPGRKYGSVALNSPTDREANDALYDYVDSREAKVAELSDAAENPWD